MHCKNGREAKSGDKVVVVAQGATAPGMSGILHTLNSQSTTCNGRLAAINPTDPYVNISDCLHVDDVAAAVIPDSSKPAA